VGVLAYSVVVVFHSPTEVTESQFGVTPKVSAGLHEPTDTEVDVKGSRVWHNPEEEGEEMDDENSSRRRGPLRASLAQIPKRLADRMENRRKSRQSVKMDNIVDIHTVPILEGQSRDDGDDASIGSSVMFKTTIVLGETDLGDIDRYVSTNQL
jgi:hypothetical protein